MCFVYTFIQKVLMNLLFFFKAKAAFDKNLEKHCDFNHTKKFSLADYLNREKKKSTPL